MHIYTCTRNYTYKKHTLREKEKACHDRTCSPYRQQAHPIGQRTTGRRTDKHTYTGYCPVLGRSTGSTLSASLALDSYRKMFPTRSPSLVIFLFHSVSPPPSLSPLLLLIVFFFFFLSYFSAHRL